MKPSNKKIIIEAKEKGAITNDDLICKFCNRSSHKDKIIYWKVRDICLNCAKSTKCDVCKSSYDSLKHNVYCSNTNHK